MLDSIKVVNEVHEYFLNSIFRKLNFPKMTRPQKILKLITSKTSNPTVKKLAFLQLQKELDIINKNPNATSRKTEIQAVYKQLYKILFFQTNCDQISDKKLIAENLCLVLDKFYDECCELDDLSKNLREEIDVEQLNVEDLLNSDLVLANDTTTSKNSTVSGKHRRFCALIALIALPCEKCALIALVEKKLFCE